MGIWSRNWLIVALLASAGAAAVADGPVQAFAGPSDTPAAVASSLNDYARELNDERFEVREAATRKLIDDRSVSTDDIIAFVRAQWDTLAPEACERLLLASRERYIASPGAIGIEFGPPPIATVARVVAGTPADKVLQRGDQFISLNGVALPQSSTEQRDELLKRMAGMKAGDVVQARIRRATEEGIREIDVEFALADPRQLPRFEDFIISMQRQMLEQWSELCEERLPHPQKMVVDLDVPGVPNIEANLESAEAERANAALTAELSRRRAEVSQEIARVMEQGTATDSPERRRVIEGEYLPLINEFARLNARLRLIDPNSRGRRR